MPAARRRPDAYRCEGDTYLIEIRLRELRQLFNTLDPAPFHEKDLDPAAEEYLVGAVREIGPHPSRVLLHLPPGTTDHQACEVVAAIRLYFINRSRHAREQLRQLFVRGGISLLIGLAFLATCLAARELLVASLTPLDAILSEGLLILGWVAMWKPVEIFLYDWWPELAQRRLFERVAHMTMETRGLASPALAGDSLPDSRLASA
jgi:hypothetical protein